MRLFKKRKKRKAKEKIKREVNKGQTFHPV
jgi:hypothetical protein